MMRKQARFQIQGIELAQPSEKWDIILIDLKWLYMPTVLSKVICLCLSSSSMSLSLLQSSVDLHCRVALIYATQLTPERQS